MKSGEKFAPGTAPDTLLIGEWTFHAGVSRLEKGPDAVRLEPRVARLLSYLAEHANRAVTRETLMEEIWPGMVVGDEALTNAINKLRKAFADDRQHPKVIETIPKVGYRLIAPVEPIHSVEQSPDELPGPGNRDLPWILRVRFSLSLVATIGAVLAALALWVLLTHNVVEISQQNGNTSLLDKPSIAVLPFSNHGQQPEQEYLADGITDDIITRLAKSRDLMVIARDSSFFYKHADLHVKIIAEKLNVRYILQGSVRATAEQNILNVQLIDAATGVHSWAEYYTYTDDDLFETEDAIARNVMAVLLNKHKLDAAIRPGNMTTEQSQAHNYLLLGRYHFYKFASKEENLKARKLFREAVELDPEYALAYAFLGWTYVFAAMNGWAENRPAALEQAAKLATRAVELEPELPLSYYVRGLSYREQGGKYIDALGEAEIALQYDPNNANARVLLATLLYYAGRPEIGVERIRDAMSINPHHPYNYHFHLGQAYFVLRKYREAEEAFLKGLASNPSSERLRVWLAATYAQSGEIENARWEAEQVLLSNPGFSVTRMEEAFPFKDPAELKHFTDGLRMAGFE